MKDDENTMREIARFLANEMTETERASFKAWLNETTTNKKLFEESKVIWELTQAPMEEAFPLNVDMAWDQFETKLPEPVVAEKNDRKPGFIQLYSKQLFRVAAIFIVGLASMLWWNWPQPVTFERLSIHTQSGEKKEWSLPDGSKVWLNENSTLEYDSSFDPRVLALNGEAFFEVTKQEGKTFEIVSGQTKTIVLGTSFNLRAYPDENQVKLVVNSGKVAFREDQPDTRPLILEAGDAGVFDRETKLLTERLDLDENAMAWKTEVLTFENTQLKNVLPVLEQYFDITIKTKNQQIINCHLTGKYERPQLDQLLNVLSYSLDLKIEKEEGTYILIGDGCPKN